MIYYLALYETGGAYCGDVIVSSAVGPGFSPSI